MSLRIWALAVLALTGCRSSRYDLILAGGRVVDGSGNGWFYGDVGVRGDRIARVGPAGSLAAASGARRIDARGLVVAPGFIDILGQSRYSALYGDGRMVAKVTQGVTTEIMGEGISNAPANDKSDPAAPRKLRGAHGFAHWLSAMQAHGVSLNVGSFVGGATVRRYAMGGKPGPPSAAELDTMRAAVRRAMTDGALGLATALGYPPGNYASTPELIALAKVAGSYGGIYATHLRSEGDRLLEAIDEALEIGRAGGLPVEIYHLKAAGERNWPKAALAIAKIDSARAAGQDVGADMYPYTAAWTTLSACIPPWASADGRLMENLSDSSTRARIHDAMLGQRSGDDLCQLATPAGVVVGGLTAARGRHIDGMRLSDLAQQRSQDWADVVIDLVKQHRRGMRAIFPLASEDAIVLQMRQPWMKFGTDAAALVGAGPRGRGHPRGYGTYPRILGRFVREQQVLTLEEAVRKMTSAVAARLSIRDRGLLREGMCADIVVFDPQSIADRATFEAPQEISTGVRYVFVNGVEVVKEGRHTGAKPGRALRGPGRGMGPT